MGVRLYLMRHGAAEDRAPTGRDADRALTPDGRAAAERVAVALHLAHEEALRLGHASPVGRVVASPLVRAQQTAEIVRGILCPALDLETDDDLQPDGSAYDLARRLASAPHDTLLVGHMPNIELVARALAAPCRPSAPPGSGPPTALRLPSHFRTATVLGFQVDGRPPPYALVLALDPTALPDA